MEDAYGPGVVPLPGRTTFYKLVDALAAGRHTFGSAVTRRQAANRPERPFTPTLAARPGEQVQIDSTPIDVMVLVLETGMTARADLTIAVDVASRTICRREFARNSEQQKIMLGAPPTSQIEEGVSVHNGGYRLSSDA